MRRAPRSASPSPTWLPQFTLTADYGTAALTHRDRCSRPAPRSGALAASGTQPLFHGFTLLHQERAAKAAYDMADAQYRNTVLDGVPERRRRVAGAAAGRRHAAGATKRAARGVRYARSCPRPVPARRHHLCDAAQRAAQLSAGAACRGPGASGALRRHRRAVSGARRRLVESHRRRCPIRSAPKPAPSTTRRRSRRRTRSNGASINDQTHGDHAGRGRRRASAGSSDSRRSRRS